MTDLNDVQLNEVQRRALELTVNSKLVDRELAVSALFKITGKEIPVFWIDSPGVLMNLATQFRLPGYERRMDSPVLGPMGTRIDWGHQRQLGGIFGLINNTLASWENAGLWPDAPTNRSFAKLVREMGHLLEPFQRVDVDRRPTKQQVRMFHDRRGDQTFQFDWQQDAVGWLIAEVTGEVIEIDATKAMLAQEVPYGWIGADFAILGQRPEEIHISANRLNNVDGPALVYRDGVKIYALNGALVNEEIILMDPEDIPIEWWLEERNAEKRVGIERKIGSERLLAALKFRTVDSETIEIQGKEHSYKLLQTTIQDNTRIALEMINPSTGQIHREWVPPHCNTVREGLLARNKTKTLPFHLS